MNPSLILYVAIGGAIGAVTRYAVMSGVGAIFGHGFPYGTLVVNITGSFILGLFIEISAIHWSPSPEVRAMIVVGVLGALTTFSTFSLDVVTLINRDEMAGAFAYVLTSVVLSVVALWLGMASVRWTF